MRTIVLGVLLLGGCTDRCKEGSLYLSYTLPASAQSADTINVTIAIGSGAPKTIPVSRKTRSATASIEIDFASYPQDQQLNIALSATENGTTVAAASRTIAAEKAARRHHLSS
jgi:hypothetical protein